jgi:hypothetical protein
LAPNKRHETAASVANTDSAGGRDGSAVVVAGSSISAGYQGGSAGCASSASSASEECRRAASECSSARSALDEGWAADPVCGQTSENSDRSALAACGSSGSTLKQNSKALRDADPDLADDRRERSADLTGGECAKVETPVLRASSLDVRRASSVQRNDASRAAADRCARRDGDGASTARRSDGGHSIARRDRDAAAISFDGQSALDRDRAASAARRAASAAGHRGAAASANGRAATLENG